MSWGRSEPTAGDTGLTVLHVPSLDDICRESKSLLPYIWAQTSPLPSTPPRLTLHARKLGFPYSQGAFLNLPGVPVP